MKTKLALPIFDHITLAVLVSKKFKENFLLACLSVSLLTRFSLNLLTRVFPTRFSFHSRVFLFTCMFSRTRVIPYPHACSFLLCMFLFSLVCSPSHARLSPLMLVFPFSFNDWRKCLVEIILLVGHFLYFFFFRQREERRQKQRQINGELEETIHK